MTVQFEFLAQARLVSGADRLSLEIPGPVDLLQALRALSDQQGEEMYDLIFDHQGELRRSLLILVNGQAVPTPAGRLLQLGDTVTLLTPMAGG